MDVSPLAVEHVQKKIEEMGVTNAQVILADVAQTDLPDQAFDLIFLFGLARPIGDMQAIWTELRRLLKTGGTISVEGRMRPPGKLFNLMKREGRISQFNEIG